MLKKLISAVILSLASCATFAEVYGSTYSCPLPNGTPFCLSSAPTVPAGCFIPAALVQPTSGAASTIEMTDGNKFYTISFSTGTGMVTSLPGCPIPYATQQ